MTERLYLCPNCFTVPDDSMANEPCVVCGNLHILECRPGDPDDPCRKPLMDNDGDVRTHAPKWWVEAYTRLAKESWGDK